MICLNEARSVLSILSIIIAKQPEEGWVMTYMELHFSVRLLIVGIALSYILAPMLWHWRAWLAPSHAVTVKY